MQNMVEGSRKEKNCAVCVWDMVNVLNTPESSQRKTAARLLEYQNMVELHF